MRTFIAINFDNDIKDKIRTVRDRIRSASRSGNFVDESNFHLTIRFIGEVSEDDIESLCMAIDEACTSFRKFDMSLGGVGFFPRGDKSIVWLGINDNKPLKILYSRIEKSLQKQGFGKNRQGLSPHITLGREVVLRKSYDEIKKENIIEDGKINVESVILYESKRVGPKLLYVPKYIKKLK